MHLAIYGNGYPEDGHMYLTKENGVPEERYALCSLVHETSNCVKQAFWSKMD